MLLPADAQRAMKAIDRHVERLHAAQHNRSAMVDEMIAILQVYKILHADSAEGANMRRTWIEALIAKRMAAIAAIDEAIPPTPLGPAFLSVHQSIRPTPFFFGETEDGPMQHPDAKPARRPRRRARAS
jgi:hypothetical protein